MNCGGRDTVTDRNTRALSQWGHTEGHRTVSPVGTRRGPQDSETSGDTPRATGTADPRPLRRSSETKTATSLGTGCHCQGPGQYVVPRSSELRCHVAFSVSVNFSVCLSRGACHRSRVLPALQDHLLSRDPDELNHTCTFCAVTCTGCRARDVGTCPRGHPSAPGRERSQHGPGRPGPRPPARPPPLTCLPTAAPLATTPQHLSPRPVRAVCSVSRAGSRPASRPPQGPGLHSHPSAWSTPQPPEPSTGLPGCLNRVQPHFFKRFICATQSAPGRGQHNRPPEWWVAADIQLL